MAIPIAYNLRNLVVRKTTTIMTALGIALTVSVLVAALALMNGLRTAFSQTGNPLHVLVLRKGGTSELGPPTSGLWLLRSIRDAGCKKSGTISGPASKS